MKKVYVMIGGALMLSALPVNAQQVPNGAFDGDWAPKAPWTSDGNTKTEGGSGANKVQLLSPDGWTVSNVIGMGGTGATAVGKQVEGHEGGFAAELVNTANPYMASQIVPAYITLGTTWSTSKVVFSGGITPTENDGGSFGGIEFAYKPDALQFYYKRSRATAPADANDATKATYKPEEPSTVVAYLWKGTWTQSAVPGNIKLIQNPATADMVDRDRCVIDYMNQPEGVTSLGGAVTKTDDAELVAVLNTTITEDAAEWTKFEKELEYKSEAAPTKMNIILAAGDYFGGASVVGNGNSLTVDDVKFIYHSGLNNITFKGVDSDVWFQDGVYEYNVSGQMPASVEDVTPVVNGKSATAKVTLDEANHCVIVVVSNVGADSDGLSEHTYKFTFSRVAPFNPEVATMSLQPANATFDGEWEVKAPWTSDGNVLSTAPALTGETITITGPKDWSLSNVIGISGLGATIVGSQVDGMEGKAIELKNAANPFMATQIVPAYLSLGTTWSTSVAAFSYAGISVEHSDGGAFGGAKFTNKPDALQFYYKRSRATAPADADDATKATYKPEEPSTVVAYLWKGEYTQADVPGNITLGSETAKWNMVNRDRNVLGMTTSEGGAVTKSDDAELIAVLNATITENATEWTKFEKELEYKSDATPAMTNIILAAGDYFGGASVVGNGNSLTVDNVKYVYYSRLKSLKVGDAAVELKDGVYDYPVDVVMPENADALVYELLGHSAQADVALDAASNKATITVSNVDADNDGAKQHVYTLTFAAKPAYESKSYDGYLTVDMGTGDISNNAAATIKVTPTSEDKCDFLLPNLSLGDLGTIGDIAVDGLTYTTAADGVTTYTGKVDNMELLGGGIHANVTVNGTITADGICDFKIDVMWLEANTPIAVTFSSYKSGLNTIGVDDVNAPVEYYNMNGVRVSGDNLPAGVYIRRQGNKVVKIQK